MLANLDWLRRYRREWLQPDLIAGLTSAAVVIPKAMAYATIAGLPVQVGLYTVFVPMIVYALLGTSRPLSVSTTTTLAILAAAALGEAVPGGDPAGLLTAGATLAVLVGAMLALAALLRLGFIANFISEPVLTGFKSGIGLVIVVDQIPKLLGIHIEKAGFFRDLFAIAGHFPQISLATLALSATLLLAIHLMERHLPRVPAPLLAVALGIGASALLGLERAGVATIGAIPGGLPTFVPPRVDLLEVLWPGAVGIALMSFTESIAAARAFGVPGEPRPQPDRELLAIGAANLASGVFGGMPAGGGTTQTAVNRKAGAHTQFAELVTAAGAIATLLVFAPVMSLMPQAALAAVVVAYSVGLIEPAEFRKIREVRRIEFQWALVAFVGVVLLGTLQGIVVAVIVSLLALAHQNFDPPVYALGRKRGTDAFRPRASAHADDETWPGLLIVRIEGRAFFLNAQHIGDRIWPLVEQAQPRVLLLDCSAVIDIEYTALKMLVEAEERLRRHGVTLWLAALNPTVLEVVQRSPLYETLGCGRMFLNLEGAVESYLRTTAPAA
ncbi:high affinity sulfate transporter 1 [Plasticicumulans lactativorans]|uniref:High affinity sulfate transporter 1 n=1 Tax=Plasticicumulans lactativorans TaxID=1133106 RepID=A0A4R2L2M2_9GAMM|nr:SulP family inorganic anion transporter [Plasticicumulans lactativorans]TCO80593.1 high affinity sulfate transporter 1 [Plasticicumulans lactativorans]